MDIQKYKAIFFDLDGILVDTASDLEFAINSMCHELSIDTPCISDIKAWMNGGTKNLINQTIKASKADNAESISIEYASDVFSKIYSESVGEHSKPYKGIKSLLVKLLANNTKVACITNKSTEYTEFMLQHNMISQFFSQITTSDNSKRLKPDPWALLDASKYFSVKIEECLMVCGSQNDVDAARMAGCDVLAVSFGYNNGQNIQDTKPDFLIDCYSDLIVQKN